MIDTAQPHAHHYPMPTHIDCKDKAIWAARCACGHLSMSVYMRNDQDATPENLEDARIAFEHIEKLLEREYVKKMLEANHD